MKTLFLALLLLIPAVSFAAPMPKNPIDIGIGTMRENGSTAGYRVLTFGWLFQPNIAVVGGALLGGRKGSWNVDGKNVPGPDMSDSFLGLQAQIWEKYLYGGVGVVRLRHQTYDLTSPYQFYLTWGVHLGNWSFSYRHLSNGKILGGGRNAGEDLLVLGYRF